jgi:hypothetical protein
MTTTARFGKKLKVPSTFQIKHQLLLFWLKNQLAKEAAEDALVVNEQNARLTSVIRLPVTATPNPAFCPATSVGP